MDKFVFEKLFSAIQDSLLRLFVDTNDHVAITKKIKFDGEIEKSLARYSFV